MQKREVQAILWLIRENNNIKKTHCSQICHTEVICWKWNRKGKMWWEQQNCGNQGVAMLLLIATPELIERQEVNGGLVDWFHQYSWLSGHWVSHGLRFILHLWSYFVFKISETPWSYFLSFNNTCWNFLMELTQQVDHVKSDFLPLVLLLLLLLSYYSFLQLPLRSRRLTTHFTNPIVDI